MSTERIRRIEELFSETVALPHLERQAFLDRACGDDNDLRHEVDSLLKFLPQSETYMERPAFNLVAQSLADGTGVLVDRMLGRYQLLSLVGRGGMAQVYCAVDSRLNRLVAVKVLPMLIAGDRERLERFEHEARAVAGLNHPHICMLHDIGSEVDMHYLIFEYLVGEPLSDRLSRGALPVAEALEYAIQIADALNYAHDQGVIHLDLKPANIMLMRGRVKLLDFGIAELRDPEVPSSGVDSANASSSDRMAYGTLGYMAPEQMDGREADSRTDVFAFGAVMYEMFTGLFAFPERGSAKAAALGMKIDPPPISQFQREAPAALDSLVMCCLSRNPSERCQSISEVL
ncbi:MAG TPA: serine/threonine-protein kinase, partial [Terriglobia bacterium]|nr:serine/threonine-protein kinase [Terriglobia bacterium]